MGAVIVTLSQLVNKTGREKLGYIRLNGGHSWNVDLMMMQGVVRFPEI
jgi:hypothetical protein